MRIISFARFITIGLIITLFTSCGQEDDSDLLDRFSQVFYLILRWPTIGPKGVCWDEK